MAGLTPLGKHRELVNRMSSQEGITAPNVDELHPQAYHYLPAASFHIESSPEGDEHNRVIYVKPNASKSDVIGAFAHHVVHAHIDNDRAADLLDAGIHAPAYDHVNAHLQSIYGDHPKEAMKIVAFEDFMYEATVAKDKYLEAHPPHMDHILERFNSATPEQREAGMNWYKDSHNVAQALATHTNEPLHKAAGLVGVYSEGTAVAPNYHYASRALIHKAPIGGDVDTNLAEIPEEGHDFNGRPVATRFQKAKARRILNGEHHTEVITTPKLSNYTHTIEQAGQHPDDIDDVSKHRVVVDRHAISAATNNKISGKEFGDMKTDEVSEKPEDREKFGRDGNSRTHAVAEAYRDATRHLRANGHPNINAEQVQAVAWGVQKARNDKVAQDNIDAKGPGWGTQKGQQTRTKNDKDAWESHFEKEHGSDGAPANPQGHWGKKMNTLAYGETVAPAKVDTLRQENCPVCGSRDTIQGNQCMNCSYVIPPEQFQDPDVETAQQVDNDQAEQQGAGQLASPDDLDEQGQLLNVRG